MHRPPSRRSRQSPPRRLNLWLPQPSAAECRVTPPTHTGGPGLRFLTANLVPSFLLAKKSSARSPLADAGRRLDIKAVSRRIKMGTPEWPQEQARKLSPAVCMEISMEKIVSPDFRSTKSQPTWPANPGPFMAPVFHPPPRTLVIFNGKMGPDLRPRKWGTRFRAQNRRPATPVYKEGRRARRRSAARLRLAAEPRSRQRGSAGCCLPPEPHSAPQQF